MKYIKTVPELKLTDLQGRIVVDERQNQLSMNLKLFLTNLLSNEKFAEEKQGSNKLFFIMEIKEQIDKQDFSAEYIEFENEQYKAIKAITESQDYDSRMAHCFVPFVRTVLNATDEK